ncbi:MAG: ferrochelatase, partial [Nitrosomonas sp.]
MITKPVYHHGTPNRTGVLLINLGTPEAPTAQALRPYLEEFLS